ncbi:MAG: PQQ-dependent sugar dehydrogenase [Acidobacteriota bacterium]
MKLYLSTASAVAVLLTVLAVPNHAAQGPAAGGPAVGGADVPRVFDTATKQRIRVVTVASGLVHPWSLAFLPDGRTMLAAERNGRLRIIRDGVLDPTPVWTAPAEPVAPVAPAEPVRPAAAAPAGTAAAAPPAAAATASPDRLHAVAVHPRFAQNHWVYLSHPKSGPRGNTLAVSRGRLEGSTLTEVREIFVAEAWESSGNMAGRMLFGPDATLYVTVGDRDRLCCVGTEDNSLRMKAQDLGNHVGKTLRLTDEGGVPKDNPFVGRAGVRPEIFTYGHRNGYGLAFHPETGALWQAEIGPLGGDEVNILLPGHNYGWPVVSMGRNYTGTLVSAEPWFQRGMDNPRMFWVPSISPSSIAFYTGTRFPTWNGSLFVGALNGKSLLRVSFNQPSQAERREPLLTSLDIRVRDVVQGPDGCLYVATEKGSGGNTPDGTILRIEPAE